MRSGWGNLVYSARTRLRGPVIEILNILMRWSREAGADLWWALMRFKEITWSSVRRCLVYTSGKGFSEDAWALEQAAQRSDYCTKSVWVHEVFREYSQAHGVTLGVSFAGPRVGPRWIWWVFCNSRASVIQWYSLDALSTQVVPGAEIKEHQKLQYSKTEHLKFCSQLNLVKLILG